MAKYRKKPVVIEAIQYTGKKGEYFIPTLEGEHKLTEGDYVICGIKGEFYPCKPDIFEQTYEKADSENLTPRSKECIQYISETTEVDEKIVIKVLQAEDEYVSYILKVLSGEKEAL